MLRHRVTVTRGNKINDETELKSSDINSEIHACAKTLKCAKYGSLVNVLPDGHGELSRGALTLSDQKGPTFPVSESTFCHTARYTTGKPAERKKEKVDGLCIELCYCGFCAAET